MLKRFTKISFESLEIWVITRLRPRQNNHQPKSGMPLYFQTACSCLGFVLNSIMTIIILITRSDAIGKYKHLLSLYTASSAIMCYCLALTGGTYFLNGRTLIYYASSNSLPFFPSQIFLVQYVVGFQQIFIYLAISFLYRYFAVCRFVNKN